MSWYARPAARRWRCVEPTGAALAFHAGLPGYRPTPLVDVPSIARELGVGRVLVKDESSRLGLPAFKVLGASWAVANVLAGRTGTDLPASLDRLRDAIDGRPVTLVTATDGNHGRAVARMASLLGIGARVVVPQFMSRWAADVIAAEGAAVERIDGDYDRAVRHAAAWAAERADAVLVQDVAWPGYERVPGWIVDGYATLTHEIDAALDATGVRPDLVAVPVGVGSLAQAVVAHYRSRPDGAPAVLSVEPEAAACALASLRAGEPRSVPTGDTVMAGLNCGTISSAAWPYLRDGLDAAIAIGDAEAVRAAGDLAIAGISSGASGAAALAGARAALTGTGADARRDELGIDGSSVVVLINTEAGHGR